jgi:hypothetical protein
LQAEKTARKPGFACITLLSAAYAMERLIFFLVESPNAIFEYSGNHPRAQQSDQHVVKYATSAHSVEPNMSAIWIGRVNFVFDVWWKVSTRKRKRVFPWPTEAGLVEGKAAEFVIMNLSLAAPWNCI